MINIGAMGKEQEIIYRLHAEICKVLGHSIRIALIDQLRDGEMSAGDLARLLNISYANLSQHLAIMRQNGIVEARREGSHIYYRISSPKVVRACRLMREVLMEHLTQNSELAKRVKGIEEL